MTATSGAQVSFEVKDDYLRVTLAGSYPTGEIRAVLLSIRSKAEELARTKLLLDAWALSPPRVDFERFVLGELVAEIFRSRYRIAVIYRPQFTNRFAENVAINRGASLFVAGSESEALEWLMR
jgi:hypothetical protein